MAISESVSACNRCGLFGRRCRFINTGFYGYGYNSYGKAQAGTTINIANIYPQGNTVYGSVAAVQPLYATNPALAITASQRAIDGGTASLEAAIRGANETNKQIAELGKIQALTAHLKAGMESSSGGGGTSSMTLKITQGGPGGIKVEQMDSTKKPPKVKPPTAQAGAGVSMLSEKCA